MPDHVDLTEVERPQHIVVVKGPGRGRRRCHRSRPDPHSRAQGASRHRTALRAPRRSGRRQPVAAQSGERGAGSRSPAATGWRSGRRPAPPTGGSSRSPDRTPAAGGWMAPSLATDGLWAWRPAVLPFGELRPKPRHHLFGEASSVLEGDLARHRAEDRLGDEVAHIQRVGDHLQLLGDRIGRTGQDQPLLTRLNVVASRPVIERLRRCVGPDRFVFLAKVCRQVGPRHQMEVVELHARLTSSLPLHGPRARSHAWRERQ